MLTAALVIGALTLAMPNKLKMPCPLLIFSQLIRLLSPGCWYKFIEANRSGPTLFAKAGHIRDQLDQGIRINILRSYSGWITAKRIWYHSIWDLKQSSYIQRGPFSHCGSYVRKQTIWQIHPMETCIAWSVFIVCVKKLCTIGYIHKAPSEDSDQTAQMHRQIWTFVGHTHLKVHFLTWQLTLTHLHVCRMDFSTFTFQIRLLPK